MKHRHGIRREAVFCLAVVLLLASCGIRPFLEAVSARPDVGVTSGFEIASGTEIIVDNGDDGYYESSSGAWTNSNLKGYLNSITRYTNKSNVLGPYVLYMPALPAGGSYRVSVYRIVEGTSDPNVKVEINHTEGTDTQYLDLTSGASGWSELGVYHFDAGSNGYVKLSLNTVNKRLRADAVKFELIAADEVQKIFLYPAADTYVNGGTAAAVNFGDASELLVKKDSDTYTRKTFMKFEQGTYSGPVGKATLFFYAAVTDPTATEAQLRLYSTDDGGWLEHELTWNSTLPQPYDFVGKVDISSVNQEYAWYGVDITSYMRAKTEEGEQPQLTIIEEMDKGVLVRLKSKESLTYKPYILIEPAAEEGTVPHWPPASRLTADNSNDETSVSLSWTSAVPADAPLSGYKIYRNGTLVDTVGASTYGYTATGLAMDTLYTFQVEAVNSLGEESRDGPYATLRTAKIGLEPVKLGNVFLEGEPVQLKFQTKRQQISWRVTQTWGNTVAEGVYTNSGSEFVLTIPVQEKGYFLLEAEMSSPGMATASVSTPFAVLADYDWSAADSSPFGFNTHLASSAAGWSKDLSVLARAAGASSVRDGLYWASVESVPGQYNFSRYSPYMEQIEQDGIEPLIMLGLENPVYDDGSTPYSQEGFQAFADYAVASMDHFGGQIKAVEIFNEFNLAGYGDRGNGPADSKPEVYFGLLKTSYEAIKAEHPEVTVVGLAAAGVPLEWIEEVFKLGGLDYMDVISIHPYQYPRVPEAMEAKVSALRQLILQYNNGQPKPIWSTEIGWPTFQGSTTEKTQGDYLVRSYVFSLANGIDKIYWYDLMNDGTDMTYNEHNFGVVRHKNDPLGAYTPKPAYAAYAAMTRALTGWTFNRAEAPAADISSYVFTRSGEETRVVWAQRSLTAAIEATGPVQVTDLMGNTRTYTPYMGKIYLSLSGEPKYIRGAVAGIAVDSTYTLTAGPALAGEPVAVSLGIANSGGAVVAGTLEAEGASVSWQAAAGASSTAGVAVPPVSHTGPFMLRGDLRTGGLLFGTLDMPLTVTGSSRVSFWPVMDAATGQKVLHLTYENLSQTRVMETGQVEWSLDTLSGSVSPGLVLAPGATADWEIPITGALEEGVSYAAAIRAAATGSADYVYSGAVSFSLVPYGSITVDGEADHEGGPPVADLAQGTINITGYGGSGDLSGVVRLNWDNSNLYLTAEITDDIFSYADSGSDIYKNDSIQFALAAELPGLAKEWYEYGISMTAGGPQIYRWLAPSGLPVGSVTGSGLLQVKRKEAQHLTVYELALPWSAIPTINPAAREGMTFSLLVNDNDGSGRKGFIEWGSGIGLTKSQAQFKTVQWGEK